MSGLPPAYDEAVSGPSHPPPPGANQSQSHYPTAAQEKANLQKHHAQTDTGEKRLVIWHAPSGNSLITAADEKTPMYNVIDSRAPSEEEQKKLSRQAQEHYEHLAQQHQQRTGAGAGAGGGASGKMSMTRQDPSSASTPADVQFAKEIQDARSHPHTAHRLKPASIWVLTVRAGGDRNSEVIATIKRHVNTKSAVSIDFRGTHTGIEQHSGFPHTKYEFKWAGRVFTWKSTHSAPGTSKFDGGSYVCKDDKKKVYAYSTSEDSRCDGSLIFEECAIEERLVDILTITGFIMRDLDDERNNPSYMRGGAYGAYGGGYGGAYGGGYGGAYGGGYGGAYGPYGSPYGAGYGFYPTPLLFPFLF